MSKFLRALAARLPCACVLAALLCTTAAHAACSLRQATLPVHIVDRRPVATVRLNGTEVKMLVDSGAFFSMLMPATAARLNLPLRRLPWGMELRGYTGAIEAQQTVVEKMGLLDFELNKVEFLVGGNEVGAGIAGILGRNVLAAGDTEYDLAHGAVRLTFPKGDCDKVMMAHWAGSAPVVEAPLIRDGTERSTSVLLEVRINGRRMDALLDTGATDTAVSLKYARRAGVEDSAMKPAGRVGGAGEGSRPSWMAMFATFELGGEKITNAQLRVADVDHREHEVLVGMDYFLTHRIYVAYSRRRVYLTWNGEQVFDPDPARSARPNPSDAALPAEVAADDADGLARRGAAALARGDHERALADMDRACELAPGVALNFYTRARVHLAMQQPARALPDLDQALRLDPTLAEARSRRARVRLAQQDREGALADLAHLDQSLPPSAHVRAEMARLYVSLRLAPEAYRQVDLWLGTHPKDEGRKALTEVRCMLYARLQDKPAQPPEGCKQAAEVRAAERTGPADESRGP